MSNLNLNIYVFFILISLVSCHSSDNSSQSSIVNSTQDPLCLEKAKSFLEDPVEIRLFEKYPSSHIFKQCESQSKGIEVIIHEAVHFEDFEVPEGLNFDETEKWLKNSSNVNKANFISLDSSDLGSIDTTKNFPPRLLIMNFLKSYYQEVLDDKDHAIHTWLNLYILDENTSASSSFSNGLTELNAYTHGLRLENRVKKKFSSDGISDKFLGQRQGLLFFIFYLKASLHEIKKTDPIVWQEFLSENNRRVIDSLVKNAEIVLSSSNHCDLIDENDKMLYSIFSDSGYFEALNEVLLNTVDLNKILCL